jgi:hypothetical protein
MDGSRDTENNGVCWRVLTDMSVTLNSTKRIDSSRPDGCPVGFEPRYVVSGNSKGGFLTALHSALPLLRCWGD